MFAHTSLTLPVAALIQSVLWSSGPDLVTDVSSFEYIVIIKVIICLILLEHKQIRCSSSCLKNNWIISFPHSLPHLFLYLYDTDTLMYPHPITVHLLITVGSTYFHPSPNGLLCPTRCAVGFNIPSGPYLSCVS